eukprot:TRINITY_DN215_c0_g1_i6.p1 TRINITY_DN215_c0_g1~~TRINITY_DN215_c0_g1_i6.p1  ORF type:complete len:545 (-),score=124.36 TRINITY_DN215_c0_g1_i6:375-2009(-)
MAAMLKRDTLDMESGASGPDSLQKAPSHFQKAITQNWRVLGAIGAASLLALGIANYRGSTNLPGRRLSESDCAAGWQQCGGSGYSGATCCESGYACQGNDWYMQCRPEGSGGPPSPPGLGTMPEPKPKPCSGASCGANPFADRVFYVNPSYRNSLTKSINTSEGAVKATLESMMDVPSAYWLDHKGKIRGDETNSMEGILKDAASKAVPELVTFIVYDLPNRDCHAKASNGEICCSYKADGRCDYSDAGDGTCSAGVQEYLEEYIKPIADVLKEYAGKVPIVLIIEPDSLPNLSTNQADPRCGNEATKSAYTKGVGEAVKMLAAADPSATIYLDAGHGGWLGWKNNMQDYVKTIDSLDIAHLIRGFATNVAGYQHLGEICPTYDWCLNGAHPEDNCCIDECGLTSEWNPSHNELQYALHLREAFSEGIRGFVPHVITDTGRNGVAGMRSDCANWCNVRGAGVGHAPTTDTAKPEVLDAYFWLKTPGESDGCTELLPDGAECPRFDADCSSVDSIGYRSTEPRAPEAGQWFDYQIKQLAMNAKLQ